MALRSTRGLPASQAGPVNFAPEVGCVPFPGYKLLRLRGRGGFATVWEATTPAGELVALKFMSSQNGHATSREVRSLQAIHALEHPNLLRTRQVWSMHGYIVIAMDLADASLHDLMMLYMDEFKKRIEPEKLCLYMSQTARALDFLNARQHTVDGRTVGYQHGDIKPGNVLLVGNKALLADYGLATPTSNTTTPCPRHGTLEYAAPEVFQGHLTESSDQFSLAVMYHLMRTAAFPYPAPPSAETVKRGYQRPLPDLSLLPVKEQAVVQRALSPIPQDRFRNCTDFVNALLESHKLRVGKQNGHTTILPAIDQRVEVKALTVK